MSIKPEYISAVARQAGVDGVILSCEQVSSDGSDRILYRLKFKDGRGCLLVFPALTLAEGLSEAKSCALICAHLHKRGVAVPELFGFDKVSGAVMFEDLGNYLLYDAVHSVKMSENDIIALYRQALQELVKFQIAGAEGFRADYCWDTSHYDVELMLNRESGYFYRELCERYFGLGQIASSLQDEFGRLANRVAEEDDSFLLHRDFQSRNLMVQGNDIGIIDFQGARFGPLAYDLCSLLNDPYVCLADKLKDELIRHYVAIAANYISLDLDTFVEGYYHIALQRNLQVLGAYAFLSQEKKKSFFTQFIKPAIGSLQTLLATKLNGEYPKLQVLTEEIAQTVSQP